MKKFTKISLIIAAIAGGIGIICALGSIALGMNGNTFVNMVRGGEFNISGWGIEHLARIAHVDNLLDDAKERIAGSEKNEGSTAYADCENLDVEMSAGTLEVYYGDVDTVQVETEHTSGFESRMDGKTLKIETHLGINSGKGDIRIILPEGMALGKVDLEIGAGSAKLDTLNLRSLDAEVGLGTLSMNLPGKETDYNYRIECAAGSVQIGDSEYMGLAREQKVANPGATKKIEIECGAGTVDIGFEE